MYAKALSICFSWAWCSWLWLRYRVMRKPGNFQLVRLMWELYWYGRLMGFWRPAREE